MAAADVAVTFDLGRQLTGAWSRALIEASIGGVENSVSALVRLIDAAPRFLIQSQYWPPEKLAAYREERLSKTLAAAAKIPFYAGRMDRDLRIEEFRRVPVLRRVEVEALYRSVYSLHRPEAHFARSLSSGTTGARAMFVFDRSTNAVVMQQGLDICAA